MLTRYKTSADGQFSVQAHLHTKEEHGIDPRQIDEDARNVIGRLRRHGHDAYLVGGCIRDLLTGRTPKDFDVVTDARPRTIVRLFARAWVIGRRFKIVHVVFGKRKVIDVTTFRADHPDSNNVFGTLEEDVRRRDFTINALYYDPDREHVIDFVDGMGDIQRRELQTVAPAEQSFLEDPVRMIRAVRYSVLADCRLPDTLRKLISRHARELTTCSPERLTEELNKILACGAAGGVLELCHQVKILHTILPGVAPRLTRRGAGRGVFEDLQKIDAEVGPADENTRIRLLAAFLAPVVPASPQAGRPGTAQNTLAEELKGVFQPLVLPNLDARRVASVLGGGSPDPGPPPRRRSGGGRGPRPRGGASSDASPTATGPTESRGRRRRRRRGPAEAAGE